MSIRLEWDGKFEIGHERIDFEHRIFLGLIREFSRHAEQKLPGDRIERTLRELIKYAEFHFVSEENLMIDMDYPELAEHRRQHGMLLARLRDRIDGLHAAREKPEDLVTFLFEWFALHTTQVDRKIADYLANR